jgi:nitrite reductase (NADH) small subunit
MNNWKKLCALEEIPRLGSRVVKSAKGDFAVFRTTEDEIFALHDKCPHKGGPLSQGLVAGKVVTCPLHSWKVRLENGAAVAPDVGCAKSFAVKLEAGTVWIAI